MKLIDSAIHRPVSVAVGVLLLVMFGMISLFRIPVQLTPNVDRPIVTVTTIWPGASPQEVEQEIVQPQEERLNTLEGLVKMTSQSSDSRGRISLEFSVGVGAGSYDESVDVRRAATAALASDAPAAREATSKRSCPTPAGTACHGSSSAVRMPYAS